MKIPTIKSQASNIPMDKGNYVCCHNGSTDKDLHVGTNMDIQVPLLVIDREMSLGHVYIVLEPVGSAHLTFVDDIMLYELCDLLTECSSESRMRSQT